MVKHGCRGLRSAYIPAYPHISIHFWPYPSIKGRPGAAARRAPNPSRRLDSNERAVSAARALASAL